jgi:hypothetical protein
MDPLSRKLFKPREAREKLRTMGGIMSSSPQLAATVQKFQDGGPVDASELQVPIVRSAIQRGGISFPSWEMMSREQRRQLGYPVSTIGGQLAFDRLTADDSARFSPNGLRIPSVEELRAAREEELRLEQEFEDPTAPMRERWGTFIAESEAERPKSGMAEFLSETLTPEAAAAERRRAVEEAAVASQPGGRPPRRDGPRREKEAPGMDTGTPLEFSEDVMPPRKGDGPPVLDPEQPETFETSYEQMLERLQGVMGKKDVNTRKQAMANLAMIGLAIASGQSPNALTNIAQGALSGMQAIRAREADVEERDEAMRLAAFKMASEQRAAQAAAEARAAESDLDRMNRLQVAQIGAESRGGAGRNPRAVEDFVQNVYTESLKAAQDVAPPQDMLEDEAPEAYAARKSRIALREQQTMFPGTYGPNPDILGRVEEARRAGVDPAKLRSDFMLQFPGVDPSLYGL